jgi:hypothetical protein
MLLLVQTPRVGLLTMQPWAPSVPHRGPYCCFCLQRGASPRHYGLNTELLEVIGVTPERCVCMLELLFTSASSSNCSG